MKKSCALGCAVLFVLTVIVIGVVMTQGRRWFDRGKGWVMTKIAEEERISAFEASWTAPSAAPDEKWAPREFGSWQLKQVDAVPTWPELDLTRPGQRAIYEQGARTLEVAVVAANELEKEVLVRRMVDAAQSAGTAAVTKPVGSSGSVTFQSGSGHWTTTMGNRTHVKAKGEVHTRIWWLRGWLFSFRARGEDPVASAEEYLRAISAPSGREIEAPVQVEAERQ